MKPSETKPKRKKDNRHTVSTRNVFRQVLLSKWSEETDSGNVKAQSDTFFQLQDPDLEDGAHNSNGDIAESW